MEKYGIENLKSVVAFGVNIGNLVTSALADGKVSVSELFGMVPALMAVPDLIAKKDAIIAEAKDLSVDEVKELAAGLSGVTSENVVATIEDALTFIVSGKNLIERFSKKAPVAVAA